MVIAQPQSRRRFVPIAIVFIDTTTANIIERPEGTTIATWFIVAIIVSSLVSRVMRSTELRIRSVSYDDTALRFVRDAAGGRSVRVIANRPDTGRSEEYAQKLSDATRTHLLPPDEPVLFLEIRPADVSAFADVLHVTGADIGGFRVLRCSSPAIPN